MVSHIDLASSLSADVASANKSTVNFSSSSGGGGTASNWGGLALQCPTVATRLYVGDLMQGNAHRQNASAAETGKPGFTWKMAARTVCVAAVMLMELVLDLLL